jgi:beta-galactosidase
MRNVVCLGVLLLGLSALCANGADYIWLEGENPTSTNLKPNIAGWGHKEFLSGEKWLHVSIDAKKVDKELPAEGGLLAYTVPVQKAGGYEIWNRIGFEFVRSPFEWRIDDGEWDTVAANQVTTDLMELDFWCEVAWLKLGRQDLSVGDHKLEIRLPKTKDAKGKTARVLYASDAICLSPTLFHPNSKYKPGESGHGPDYAKAADQMFLLPAPAGPAARASVPLDGLWEVCRHDELLPGPVAEPIKDFPAEPHWTAIRVPGDKNKLRPDLLFAHRLWYRTRVKVPESCAGRSFQITFPQNNLNTTVFVNGVYCGFNKNPFARFTIDVTAGIKPGVNEVWVGIRDAYYGYSANPKDPMKLRRTFNFPLKVTERGFQQLAYPVWRHFQSGILVTPTFTVSGPAYVSDAFCKPSVSRGELGLEISLKNPGKTPVQGELLCEALEGATDKVGKTFATIPFSVASGAETTLNVAEPWQNPTLWWPDAPALYRLRTTLSVDGKQTDISETSFGFREWTWNGRFFKLNGVRWQLWADCFTAGSKEEWLDLYHQNNERMMRFWGTRWRGMPPEQALDWFDRNGVVVRRSGIFDGEAIGYLAIEKDPVLKEMYGGSPIKMDLMQNWRDQMVAQVKGERNHPSVMIWSIENEWLYINCINLYRKFLDQFEAEVQKTADAVMAADPTRPTMNDGGGAHKNNSVPVAGDHYVTGDYWRYPALAYDANTKGGGRGRWEWDEKRPRFIGEDFFITGNNPKLAYFGGEEAFQGKASTRPAASIMARMLMEGYRWAGQSAWQFWMGQNDAPGQYQSYAPRAVFCRQWDWTFASGATVPRTLRIANDTRFDDPITLTSELVVAGRRIANTTTTYELAPGSDQITEVQLAMPKTGERVEGEWRLALTINGKEVFRDTKAVSVLPAAEQSAKLDAKDLLVLDPSGDVTAFLNAHQTPFTPVASLDALPATGKVILVGRNALDRVNSTSSQLAACAADERRVIVLEQQHPLHFQGLPAEMSADTNQGTTAFAENLTHPALRGLAQKDFFTWGPDEIVYRNAYHKPVRGARSLIQCHDLLQNSALAEVPVGEGLMLLCQLTVGEKLATNVVAQHLLCNLIDYAGEYRLEHRAVAACLGDDQQFGKALDAMGLVYETVDSPLKALAGTGSRIAIVAATPANLKDSRPTGWPTTTGLSASTT